MEPSTRDDPQFSEAGGGKPPSGQIDPSPLFRRMGQNCAEYRFGGTHTGPLLSDTPRLYCPNRERVL